MACAGRAQLDGRSAARQIEIARDAQRADAAAGRRSAAAGQIDRLARSDVDRAVALDGLTAAEAERRGLGGQIDDGPDGEMSVAQWTAPADWSGGDAAIQGQFFPGDSGIMQVGIFENGNWALPLWSASDSGSFTLSVPVAAGDTIDFGVYGGYSYGNTPLDATITAAPEPSTLVLLGIGAISLLGYAWRRRAA